MANLSLSFQCLQLAASCNTGKSPKEITDCAKEFLSFLLGKDEEQAEDPTEPGAAKRGRKAKPVSETDSLPSTIQDISEDDAKPVKTGKVVYADVAQAVFDLITAKGKPAVVEVLGEFGASNAKQLKEDQWAECLKNLKAMMA